MHPRQALRDVLVLTQRNLFHIAREPLRLSDVTIQPVLFTLLFIYVLGSGIVLPHGGSYTDYAIAGLLAMNLTTSAIGTAVGLSDDLGTGVIDRFRTLPMWRPAILVGRSLADLLTATLCALIVIATGLVVGWRPDNDVLSVIGGIALFLLFSYAISWMCACIGLASRDAEASQGLGLIVLFPLARDRLKRLGPDRAHAGGRACDRQLEPRQRSDLRGTQPLRQPESVCRGPRLADAAPGARGRPLVARAAGRVRTAGRAALPHADARLRGRVGVGIDQRRQPAPRLLQGPSLAGGVVLELVGADPAHAEVARLRV